MFKTEQMKIKIESFLSDDNISSTVYASKYRILCFPAILSPDPHRFWRYTLRSVCRSPFFVLFPFLLSCGFALHGPPLVHLYSIVRGSVSLDFFSPYQRIITSIENGNISLLTILTLPLFGHLEATSAETSMLRSHCTDREIIARTL